MWRIWVTGTPAGAGTNMIMVETNSLSWLQCGDGGLYEKSSYFRIPSQLVGSFRIASPLNAEEVAEQIVLFRGHCGSSAAIQPSGFLYNAFFPSWNWNSWNWNSFAKRGSKKALSQEETQDSPAPLPSSIHMENLFRFKSGGSQSHHISIPAQGQFSDPSETLNVYPWQTGKKKCCWLWEVNWHAQLQHISVVKEGFRFT